MPSTNRKWALGPFSIHRPLARPSLFESRCGDRRMEGEESGFEAGSPRDSDAGSLETGITVGNHSQWNGRTIRDTPLQVRSGRRRGGTSRAARLLASEGGLAVTATWACNLRADRDVGVYECRVRREREMLLLSSPMAIPLLTPAKPPNDERSNPAGEGKYVLVYATVPSWTRHMQRQESTSSNYTFTRRTAC